MADALITSLAGSLGSSGANVLLPVLSDFFVEAARNSGSPLRSITDVSPTVASFGETARVWIAPDASSNLLTDGNAVTKNDSPGTTASITLNRHRECTFSLTQVGAALAGNNMAQKLIQSRVAWLLNGVEEDVLSVHSSFDTNAFAGTAATAITEAEAVEAVQKLKDQRAPAPYFALIDSGSATAWSAMVQIANFVQAQGQSNPWLTVKPSWGGGYFWNDTFWFPTQAVAVAGTTSYNLVFAPSAIAIAMRPLPAPMAPGVLHQNVVDPSSGVAFSICVSYDNNRLSDQVTLHTLYGYAMTKNAYGVVLRS